MIRQMSRKAAKGESVHNKKLLFSSWFGPRVLEWVVLTFAAGAGDTNTDSSATTHLRKMLMKQAYRRQGGVSIF